MSPTSLLLLLSLAILNPLPGSDPADDDIREDLLEARDMGWGVAARECQGRMVGVTT